MKSEFGGVYLAVFENEVVSNTPCRLLEAGCDVVAEG
jgi:hypothetical protein